MMGQGSWDNLGDLSPDHYDPSGIDPTTMRDLKDPSQPAGPIPQYHEAALHGMGNGNGNGRHQMHSPSVEETVNARPGVPRTRNISAPPNPQSWDNLGALADDAASDPYSVSEVSYVHPMQNIVQRRKGTPPPPAPEMISKSKSNMLLVGVALAAGFGVWWWNNRRR